ncbi:hypothetical protein ACFL3H_03780 [Gemmatimonadota bacterium]
MYDTTTTQFHPDSLLIHNSFSYRVHDQFSVPVQSVDPATIRSRFDQSLWQGKELVVSELDPIEQGEKKAKRMISHTVQGVSEPEGGDGWTGCRGSGIPCMPHEKNRRRQRWI